MYIGYLIVVSVKLNHVSPLYRRKGIQIFRGKYNLPLHIFFAVLFDSLDLESGLNNLIIRASAPKAVRSPEGISVWCKFIPVKLSAGNSLYRHNFPKLKYNGVEKHHKAEFYTHGFPVLRKYNVGG